MWLGIGLGLLSLAVVFGFRPLPRPLFLVAAAVAGMYYLAMLLGTLFPGTAWNGPEFDGTFRKPLGLHRQQLLGCAAVLLLAVATVLALRRPAPGRRQQGWAETEVPHGHVQQPHRRPQSNPPPGVSAPPTAAAVPGSRACISPSPAAPPCRAVATEGQRCDQGGPGVTND